MQALLIGVSVAVFFMQSCKKSFTATLPANVIIVDGCTGATSVIARVNGTLVPNADGLGFFDYTGYKPVTANTNSNVSFYQYAGNLLCTTTSNFSAGSYYTVFAAGNTKTPAIVITTDDLSAPKKGYAKVRFINLSGDNYNEDFYIGGKKLDSNIVYSQCTSFVQVLPDSVNVLVQDPAYRSAPYIAQLTKKVFDTGRIYTIMLTGTYTGKNTTVLRLTVINNN